jgi:hypothetical protein
MAVFALSRFGRVLAYSRAMGPRHALPWALAIAVVCAASPASALPVLSFVNTPATITAGQTFTVDIGVGLTSADTSDDVLDLVAFQFGILFDPLLVEAVSVSEGSFLASGGGTTLFLPGAIDNTAGNITFNAGVLDAPFPGVSGAGTLMSLQLLALANGTNPISILFDPLNGDGLYDSVGATLGPQSRGSGRRRST